MWDNPIVVREMRARMRNNKALGLQFLVLAVLGFAVFSALLMASHGDRSMTTGWLGLHLFRTIGAVQGLLLALLAPAFAAGAFTLEREQQTIESLMLSPLRAGPLVRGKLVAAILFPTLLMTLALPMLALTLLYGGVGPQDLFGTYTIQLLNGLFLGCLALGWSMVCKSTASAVVATYLTVATYLFGTMILGALAMDEPLAIGALCPAMAPFVASETVALFGRPVPIWIPSAALLLYCTAWCLDVCVVRAKEMRQERGSGRPRVWALVFCFIGGLTIGQLTSAASAGSGYYHLNDAVGALQLLVCIAGALGALIFGTVDSPAERPWRGWWRIWAPLQGSAPSFVALAPWAALFGFWLVPPAASLLTATPAWTPPDWNPALGVTTSLSTALFSATWLMVWLQQRIGTRWSALFVGLVLLALFHASFAEMTFLVSDHSDERMLEVIPALSPYPVLLMLFSGSKGIWVWGSVGLGACGQFVILLLLWLGRATPLPGLKLGSEPARGSPAGSSPG